ncbi:hypothetical protein [Rhizobium sp. MHM7A]|uniref:hypothetical protein n=1 Tax=Rhizobium sp. MHM7A TaxID=2583233 RepID=UPI0011058CD6|nr:hypothetical protein [Rhizobium sp. MHM7A]TLX17200.1 hypothetical protein FFR93_07775 [Rhizobium sp. MHM7A]
MANDCKEHTVNMSCEELASAVRFTMEDHQRLLRQSDVKDICPSQNLCFEYSDRVRCGPCAIRQSMKFGVQVDDTLPFAPEQYRLQRKLKGAVDDIANLRKALLEVVAICSANDTDPVKLRDAIKANSDNYASLTLKTDIAEPQEAG